MELTIGLSFGTISGILTSLGLVLSNLGANIKTKYIILMLISLALSDGMSDAMGIYYGTYSDDRDLSKAYNEALKTWMGKSILPLSMALIFFIFQNNTLAGVINIILAFVFYLFINIKIFSNIRTILINIFIFSIIIILNYYLGKYLK